MAAMLAFPHMPQLEVAKKLRRQRSGSTISGFLGLMFTIFPASAESLDGQWDIEAISAQSRMMPSVSEKTGGEIKIVPRRAHRHRHAATREPDLKRLLGGE